MDSMEIISRRGQPETRAQVRGLEDIPAVALAYGLILLALWTPRPWQRWFGLAALAWVVLETALNFKGWDALGLRRRGFRGSVWIVGAAIAASLAAGFVSAKLGALHVPPRPELFVKRYWLYAAWAFIQEFLLLDFFLRRLLRLMGNKTAAALVTAGLFALAHVPNPVLMPLALAWGLIACAVFLRWRNLYPLGMAHAILGICIAVSVPGPMDHNMRVGLGYLKYRAPVSAPKAHIISAISPRSYPRSHE
jgi:membrane protease YdiL (CAAX protease family)